MTKRLIAAVLAASLLAIAGGCAIHLEEIPFDEHISGEPPQIFTVLYGTIESVRPDAEIVVRLEDGTTIAVVQAGSQGFAPGQRVRVLSGAGGSRLERARAI
jgi:outer membrane lipoprotein SlyB